MQRSPYDTRDAEEHAAIAQILAELPAEHAARRAYDEGANTIALTHLAGRADLAEGLKHAWLAGYRRHLDRTMGYFRP